MTLTLKKYSILAVMGLTLLLWGPWDDPESPFGCSRADMQHGVVLD